MESEGNDSEMLGHTNPDVVRPTDHLLTGPTAPVVIRPMDPEEMVLDGPEVAATSASKEDECRVRQRQIVRDDEDVQEADDGKDVQLTNHGDEGKKFDGISSMDKENEAKENSVNFEGKELVATEKKDLKAEENAFETKESNLKASESDLEDKENDVKATENDFEAKENDVKATENDIEAQESDVKIDSKGYDTPDTDQEEEERRRRVLESKKKGTKLVQRMSFKRDRADRHYDKLPWGVGAISRLLNLAPARLPWHRRMETTAVLLWMSSFLFMGFAATGLLVYMFLYTQYWWLSLCYLCWYIPDRSICNRGGRRWNWVRNWGLWKHYANFFPIRLVKTTELDPDHNYIMCYHPHGILSAGAFCTFATDGVYWSQTFPGLTPYLLTLEVLFLMPFYREFFLCSGAVSATRASMDHLLGREGSGRALCLVVGGAPESLDCHPGQVVLHLEKRKGFAKMALRHGASLVPMFGFGENDVYDQVANPKGSLVRRVQDALQHMFGLAPCIFMGRGVFQYSFGIVPYRKPIFVVVGSPIHVEPVKKPTDEQILALHERYKQAIVELYNEHKETYAKDPTVPIQIV